MTSFVDQFVTALRRAEVPDGFTNPYNRAVPAHNLRVFLSMYLAAPPDVIMVGEAPGYRGAVVTGVPFTSQEILEGVAPDPWTLFGTHLGYRMEEQAAYTREATATVFWSTVTDVLSDCRPPLTWNAVPFHPRPDGIRGNGNLRKADLAIGEYWIQSLRLQFSTSTWVAIGARASEALSRLDIQHAHVRHPSYGGKKEFVAGLRKAKSEMTRHAVPPSSVKLRARLHALTRPIDA